MGVVVDFYRAARGSLNLALVWVPYAWRRPSAVDWRALFITPKGLSFRTLIATLMDAIYLPAFARLLPRRLNNLPLRRILIRDNGWGNGALK